MTDMTTREGTSTAGGVLDRDSKATGTDRRPDTAPEPTPPGVYEDIGEHGSLEVAADSPNVTEAQMSPIAPAITVLEDGAADPEREQVQARVEVLREIVAQPIPEGDRLESEAEGVTYHDRLLRDAEKQLSVGSREDQELVKARAEALLHKKARADVRAMGEKSSAEAQWKAAQVAAPTVVAARERAEAAKLAAEEAASLAKDEVTVREDAAEAKPSAIVPFVQPASEVAVVEPEVEAVGPEVRKVVPGLKDITLGRERQANGEPLVVKEANIISGEHSVAGAAEQPEEATDAEVQKAAWVVAVEGQREGESDQEYYQRVIVARQAEVAARERDTKVQKAAWVVAVEGPREEETDAEYHQRIIKARQAEVAEDAMEAEGTVKGEVSETRPTFKGPVMEGMRNVWGRLQRRVGVLSAIAVHGELRKQGASFFEAFTTADAYLYARNQIQYKKWMGRLGIVKIADKLSENDRLVKIVNELPLPKGTSLNQAVIARAEAKVKHDIRDAKSAAELAMEYSNNPDELAALGREVEENKDKYAAARDAIHRTALEQLIFMDKLAKRSKKAGGELSETEKPELLNAIKEYVETLSSDRLEKGINIVAKQWDIYKADFVSSKEFISAEAEVHNARLALAQAEKDGKSGDDGVDYTVLVLYKNAFGGYTLEMGGAQTTVAELEAMVQQHKGDRTSEERPEAAQSRASTPVPPAPLEEPVELSVPSAVEVGVREEETASELEARLLRWAHAQLVERNVIQSSASTDSYFGSKWIRDVVWAQDVDGVVGVLGSIATLRGGEAMSSKAEEVFRTQVSEVSLSEVKQHAVNVAIIYLRDARERGSEDVSAPSAIAEPAPEQEEGMTAEVEDRLRRLGVID